MKCPVDSTELTMTARDGVEIDYCPKCRGVWLDRGELDKILDRAMQEMDGGPESNGDPRGQGGGGYRDQGMQDGPGGPRYQDDGRYPPNQSGGRWNSGPDDRGSPMDDPRGRPYGPGGEGPSGPQGGRPRSILDIFNI